MHELSIAQSLVEAAEYAAHQHNATRVTKVYLKLGVFSGVDKNALLFGYEIATRGTLLEDSILEIEDVPVVLFCPTCNTEVTIDNIQLFCCPQCGTPTADIRQGRELEITSLEITHDTEIAHP